MLKTGTLIRLSPHHQQIERGEETEKEREREEEEEEYEKTEGKKVAAPRGQKGVDYLVEQIHEDTLVLRNIEKPYEHLKISQTGAVSFSSEGSVKASQLQAIFHSSLSPVSHVVSFQSVANRKKPSSSGSEGWHLGFLGDSLQGNVPAGPDSCFLLTILAHEAVFRPTSVTLTDQRRKALNASQKKMFRDTGYLQIRSVVPQELINMALKLINHEMGCPGSLVPSGDETGMAKLAGNVSNAPEIKALLLNCDTLAYVESLLGDGNCDHPQGAQIALRFPEFGALEELPGNDWHTDGMRQAKRNPFSLLVGITLSDTVEPLSGNFTVFPGTHHTIFKMLSEDQDSIPLNSGANRQRSNQNPALDFGTPLQLTSLKGDIVIAHPHLAHRVAPNYSPNIRYQVYFRIKHVRHNSLLDALVTDMWADLEGLA